MIMFQGYARGRERVSILACLEVPLRETCTVLATGRKGAPGRWKSTCKGPEAGDPGPQGQEASVAGRGERRKTWGRGGSVS